jgi:single-strand DNA-binding protein
LNRIILIGRLTADPEIRKTPNGISVTRVSIAVDRRYKSASGERETDFINVVAWRKLADLLGEYMKKGRQIAVEGSLQMNRYQTKEGEKRTTYEVVAENIQFLDRGSSSGGSSADIAPMPSESDAPPEPSGFGDSGNSGNQEGDLPF